MLSRFLETVAGDTLSFRIVLRDGSSPVDVSPMVFSGGVKNPGAKTNIVDFQFEVIPGPIGVVRVTLTPEQTRRLTATDRLYEWYVRVETENFAKTLGGGALKVISL